MTDEQDIRRQIDRLATDGRAACKAMLELAERTETTPKKIGELCNDMSVRIVGCQLGCFG